MRVLWTSNIPLSDVATKMGLPDAPSGSWMSALADALAARCGEIVLGVATMHPKAPAGKHVIRGVAYYIMPCGRGDAARPPNHRLRRRFSEVLEDFRPDLIHVNGSEYNYGLIASDVAPHVPTVLSIQGLVGQCAKVYWGGMSLGDLLRFRTLRDWLRLDGLIEQRWKWRRRSRMEVETLQRMGHIIGRSVWDRAHARAVNPGATYYFGQELLRREFFETAWDLSNVKRGTIFACAGGYPLKGLHVLLEAIHLLKPDYPGIRLRIPGIRLDPHTWWERLRLDGYRKYLIHRIHALGLERHVSALGVLNARRMADELAAAHVFVAPSFIENLSNSLAEAMLVGTPCVASYVGGMISTVHDRVEAFSFPAGDAAILAERIRSLFENDALALTLSENARRRARERHNPEEIVQQTMAIYRSVLQKDHIVHRKAAA